MEIDKVAAAHGQEMDDESMARVNAHLNANRSLEDSLHDDVDIQLLPVFLEEADELCPKIAGCLHALREENNYDAHLINRLLHTLKGSARMTGVMSIGHIAHEMEGRLLAGITANEDGLREALENDFAQINRLLEALRHFVAEDDRADKADEPDWNADFAETRVSQRLYRTARQTAKELGRRVNLELTGCKVAPGVLDTMTAPLEHLLRNAIVHGIEDEQQRIAGGKAAIGEIRLNLRCEKNEVVFELSDDGRGLNLAALRAQAIEKGLLDADAYASCEQLAQLIFTPGLSTVSEVTQVAGRGTGMDVVRSEIAALGGRIEVSSQAGTGTQFTIHLPTPQ